MSNAIVTVKNVDKSFSEGASETRVLQGVSFEVKRSEFVSVMGPSGCGKSTLLYLIGGLESPDSGKIICCGADFSKLSDAEQSKVRLNRIGFVFQFCNLVQNLSVEENILLPVIMAGKRAEAYRPRMEELLTLMDIADKRSSLPSKLSGGQQQRVALARAVIARPDLILADEPTGNLDSESGAVVLDILSKLHREHGVSIIMVTHSEEAAERADRVIHLRDGKLV